MLKLYTFDDEDGVKKFLKITDIGSGISDCYFVDLYWPLPILQVRELYILLYTCYIYEHQIEKKISQANIQFVFLWHVHNEE